MPRVVRFFFLLFYFFNYKKKVVNMRTLWRELTQQTTHTNWNKDLTKLTDSSNVCFSAAAKILQNTNPLKHITHTHTHTIHTHSLKNSYLISSLNFTCAYVVDLLTTGNVVVDLFIGYTGFWKLDYKIFLFLLRLRYYTTIACSWMNEIENISIKRVHNNVWYIYL